MKALVQDKVRDWTEKFSSLGVKCQELTSDSGPTNVLDMLDTDIILTTPEVMHANILVHFGSVNIAIVSCLPRDKD